MTEHRAAVASLGEPAVRTVVLEERIRYSYSRPVTDLRQYLRILPPASHGPQRRGRWNLTVDGVESSKVRTLTDSFGNVTMAVRVPRVDEAVEFNLSVEAATATVPLGPGHCVVADRRCLGSTPLTSPDAAIAELARIGGDPDVASLCERVHTSIAYEWGITGVHTSASEALAGGRGVCQDYAHIMLAACRLVGIPARYVSGHLTGEGGSHAWVEVLRPVRALAKTNGANRRAWTVESWDPTHNRRTDADYLVVAVGRDYADAAPMWGTFEGEDVTSTLLVEKHLVEKQPMGKGPLGKGLCAAPR
jgi:transglutaminase-like putative cysteine protease